MNKPLCGQDIWKDIWVHLQEPEAVLTVIHVITHKALIPAGNQEADALTWVQVLAIDSLSLSLF